MEKTILYRILVCQSKDNSFRSKYFIGNKIEILHITFVKFVFDHSQKKKKKEKKKIEIKLTKMTNNMRHKNPKGYFYNIFFIIQLK